MSGAESIAGGLGALATGGPTRHDMTDERVEHGPAVEPVVRAADGVSFEREFEEFFRVARDPLFRMAYLLSGDPHRADDLVQQTFERTWRSWRSARQGDPLVWSRRVLANLRIDTWRRTRREVLTETDADGATEGGERAVDGRDAVVRALLTLPVRQRRIVVLRHLLELSEAEVAAELGVSVGTVKSTTRSARGGRASWPTRMSTASRSSATA